MGNVERLEEHAERMSEKGSDLGEEIRKLQLEQKQSDSRRSSLRSGALADEPTRLFSTRSRNASTSSYTNSIVDVNGAARWGGYSPGGYVTSPVGSLRSGGSLSQAPPTLQRQRSTSKASRLGQVVHPEEDEEDAKRPEEQPSAPGSQQAGPREHSPPPPSHRSVSSFTRQYDQIAQEIQDELQQSVIHGDQYDPDHHGQHHELPDRPATAASTDTTHKLRTLWSDFDGVHCPDTVPEEDAEYSHHSGSRSSSMIKPPPDMPPMGAPPPGDNMVFYPAPVPKMLNLPQRLSKVPAGAIQARRRTQLLETMQAENRKSAPWLSEMGAEPSRANRKSRQSLANLPPQLRASAYFDQPAPVQEFEVKGESAEDTLDSILEASAHAPVSAFTDHPFAGHVGNEVYGAEHREHKRKGSKANELDKVDKAETRKSRSSLNLLDTRRNSSGDPLNKLKKRNSSADLNLLTVRATESRMSLGEELDHPDPNARGPEPADDDTPRRQSFDGEHYGESADEGEEEEEEEPEEPEEQYFGPPTTLLAELQMRKQQQKSRNLTAATAFPNGMHATLLELDAVAEIEKKKRKGQKVNLAWEAQPPPAEDDGSDDDVPLGVLFPGRDGLVNKKAGGNAQAVSDWDRPLGLIAQRELEDNEPLSRRRNRLVGNRVTRDLSPSKRQTQFGEPHGQHLTVPTTTTPQPESEEDEGETLAQRMRRIRDKQTLDDAIGPDVRKSTVSGDFAAEMLSQLGVNEEEKPKPTASPANGEGVEETLGQRRARLQAEALARGDANPRASRPALRTSMSLADVLGAHPIDPNNSARKVSDEALVASLPQGSLLRQNAEKQERRKATRQDQNQRISSYGSLDKPLLGGDVGKDPDDQPLAAKIQAYKDKMNTPTVAPPNRPSMMLNNHSTPDLNPAMSSLNIPGQRTSYFPQPQPSMPMMGMNSMNGMGMAPAAFGGMNMMAPNMMAPQMMTPQMMPMNAGVMGMPMGGMQGMGYPQMSGIRHSSMINLPQMGQMGGIGLQMQMQMQQPMMMEPPMDPRQREVIDRWRQGVSP